jgi:Cu/Ag efflux protein CusF
LVLQGLQSRSENPTPARARPELGGKLSINRINWSGSTMNSSKRSIAALCLACALGFGAEVEAATPKGEALVATMEATAVVTAIDQKTREVTLKLEDGTETTLVAGEEVQNLAQVKPGDVLRVVYAEALAYEVKKGGTTVAPETSVAGGAAELGQKPEGALARQTTATVIITAIDPKVPSVTFKGPAGNTRTIKVMHPEKLTGVSVGDTVELTYTEAVAIKVEAPAAK